MSGRARVLLTKSYIDSHDRAIKTIATLLRDAGMEVVLTDYQVPEDIVATAMDEDVSVIGLSFMSGGQVEVSSRVVQLLRASEATIPVIVGGTIRPFDVGPLNDVGITHIFRGGEKLTTISETFRKVADSQGHVASS
jgi:methylmalonyl-CoA mutase C-terminal domain/subunit